MTRIQKKMSQSERPQRKSQSQSQSQAPAETESGRLLLEISKILLIYQFRTIFLKLHLPRGVKMNRIKTGSAG